MGVQARPLEPARSPEEVCRICPELLQAVREELRRLRDFKGAVKAMFPVHGLGGLGSSPSLAWS